jgi:hypothetical protein
VGIKVVGKKKVSFKELEQVVVVKVARSEE